jgi:hypothetical protein
LSGGSSGGSVIGGSVGTATSGQGNIGSAGEFANSRVYAGAGGGAGSAAGTPSRVQTPGDPITYFGIAMAGGGFGYSTSQSGGVDASDASTYGYGGNGAPKGTASFASKGGSGASGVVIIRYAV